MFRIMVKIQPSTIFQIKRKYVFGMKLTMVKHKTAEFVLLSMQLILINLLSIGLH